MKNTVMFRGTNVKTGKQERVKISGNNPEQGQQEIYILCKHIGIMNIQAYEVVALFESWTAHNNAPKSYKRVYQDTASGSILEVRRLDTV